MAGMVGPNPYGKSGTVKFGAPTPAAPGGKQKPSFPVGPNMIRPLPLVGKKPAVGPKKGK